METITLGNTGLEITRLGMGLSELGFNFDLSSGGVEKAAAVLNRALDGGITFLDTSACYGDSEELVGRAVSHRRSEFVLATKCGHAVGDETGKEWTAAVVTNSIDRSLVCLKTDSLDLIQLHSCDRETLERGEATEALLRAKEAGKTRFAGYSGDNDAARWAVESGLFDTLQTSFSVADQHARSKGLLRLAKQKGMGVIIKRPIANGSWLATSNPSEYATEYFARAQKMAGLGDVEGAPADRIMTALAFTFAHPEVDTAIVGTRNPDHMASNIRMVEGNMELSEGVVRELQRRFDALEENWLQLE